MPGAPYTEQELLATLPELPPKASQISRFGRQTMDRLFAGISDRQLLGEPCLIPRGPASYNGYRPDPDIDLRQKNAVGRKLTSIEGNNRDIRMSINTALDGGGPVLGLITTIVGIGYGMINPVAGIVYSLSMAGVSFIEDPAPVRARDGDEVHQWEVIGKDGSKLMHSNMLLLVDPLRSTNTKIISRWVIAEERKELVL
jgi:hypothetical protein